jgi:RNA polymerase sigma factor (sigma-70 family)
MRDATATLTMGAEQDRLIRQAVVRERGRLRSFIRARVADVDEAEDILQDVFAELVSAYRLVRPVEQVAGWLLAVARNRIIDRYRRRRRRPEGAAGDAGLSTVLELLPSAEAGPATAYARTVLVDELEAALAELPAAQREVFIAHELEGRSFRDIAATTGVNVNTLLARKHAAVSHLRDRLRDIHEVFASERTP